MEPRRKERIDRGTKVRSDSIYAVASLKEIMYLVGPRLALIAGLLVLPQLMPNAYWQRVLSIAGVYAMLAMGFDFLANFVGLVSLGGALYVGVGGYLSGLLNAAYNLPPVLTIPAATLAGALFCTLLLLPCLPLRGVYFAIVSFVYPLAAERLIAATGSFGGTEGIAGLAVLRGAWAGQYAILVAVLICLFALCRLVYHEDAGVVFRGVKDNDQAIMASGINATWYKAKAVFITAAMGCFAGAYLSHLYGWVGMSLFAIDFSILPLAATVVGGPGTLYGPLVGAFLLVPISEALRGFGTLRIVFYAIAIILFVVFWTEGLMNYLRRKYEQFERWVKV